MDVQDPELQFSFDLEQLLFEGGGAYIPSQGTEEKIISYYQRLKQAIAERAPQMAFQRLNVDRFGATALYQSGYIAPSVLEQSVETKEGLLFIIKIEGDEVVVCLQARLMHDNFEFVLGGLPYGHREVQELEELEEA